MRKLVYDVFMSPITWAIMLGIVIGICFCLGLQGLGEDIYG